MKKSIVYISVVLAVVACCEIIYRHQDAKASLAMENLQHEFELIPPPVDAKVLEQNVHHKAGSAYVEFHYSTTSSFELVVDHYTENLQKHGWQFKGKRILPSNTESVGFCKNSYSATIEHNTANSSPLVFWFGMNWGLNSCEAPDSQGYKYHELQEVFTISTSFALIGTFLSCISVKPGYIADDKAATAKATLDRGAFRCSVDGKPNLLLGWKVQQEFRVSAVDHP